jgi:hypothetical protein
MDPSVHGLRELVLAHHPPAAYDRCTVVEGHHVCRRCSVLYPVALAMLGLSLAGIHWPASLDALLLLALPVPVVTEFVLEQSGAIRYSPRRQVAVTAVAALALGQGFARYLANGRDRIFWTMVGVHAGICLAAFIAGSHVRRRRAAAERIKADEAHPLLRGFASAEEFQAYLESAVTAEG